MWCGASECNAGVVRLDQFFGTKVYLIDVSALPFRSPRGSSPPTGGSRRYPKDAPGAIVAGLGRPPESLALGRPALRPGAWQFRGLLRRMRDSQRYICSGKGMTLKC
jgi:hypothetical protein